MMPDLGYTEMKDSGTVWLGEIPSDWEISKIGSLYTQRNEKVSDKDYPPLSVTMKGILPQLDTAAKTEDGDNRKLVKIGDFAINSRSDRRGSCGISPYNGSVSLINTILTPRNAMHPGYYNWLFHTSLFADEFYKWGHGIVDDLWTTRWQEMKKIIVPVPPYNIQEQISAYLDAQCAKIDEIIAEAKASIEDYKKWKASIIYEAVTKGLDPDVEMKESGIKGAEKVPSHWAISRLKYISYLDPKCAIIHITDEDEVTFAPMECIRNDRRIARVAPKSNDNGTYSSFMNGDIAIAKVTPCFENGNICVMENLVNGYAFGSSELFAIRPHSIITRFLFYYMQSCCFVDGGVSTMTGVGGLKRVSSYYMKNAYIPIPPTHEQNSIAKYLDNKCSQIEKLIIEKEVLISDLESYKKSLIYEVVTGKRRVC